MDALRQLENWPAEGNNHEDLERGTDRNILSNLVMIGRFKSVKGASEAKRIIERLTEQVGQT